MTKDGLKLLIDSARQLNILRCENWVELFWAIKINGVVYGTRNQPYTPDELIGKIEKIRQGQVEIVKQIPRTNGLREKVIELLNKYY
jgi:hypothetical protein